MIFNLTNQVYFSSTASKTHPIESRDRISKKRANTWDSQFKPKTKQITARPKPHSHSLFRGVGDVLQFVFFSLRKKEKKTEYCENKPWKPYSWIAYRRVFAISCTRTPSSSRSVSVLSFPPRWCFAFIFSCLWLWDRWLWLGYL